MPLVADAGSTFCGTGLLLETILPPETIRLLNAIRPREQFRHYHDQRCKTRRSEFCDRQTSLPRGSSAVVWGAPIPLTVTSTLRSCANR